MGWKMMADGGATDEVDEAMATAATVGVRRMRWRRPVMGDGDA